MSGHRAVVGSTSGAGGYFDGFAARWHAPGVGASSKAAANALYSQRDHDELEAHFGFRAPVSSSSSSISAAAAVTGRYDAEPPMALRSGEVARLSEVDESAGIYHILIPCTVGTKDNTTTTSSPLSAPSYSRGQDMRLALPSLGQRYQEALVPEEEEEGQVIAALWTVAGQGRSYKCIAALLVVVLYAGVFL